MIQASPTSPPDRTPEFARDPLRFLRQHHREPVVRFRLNDLPYLLINDVHAVHELLVGKSEYFTRTEFSREALAPFLGMSLLTSDGAYHRQQRRMMQPAFHHHRIDAYAGLMVRHIARMLGRWDDGAHLTVMDEMIHMSLGTVTEALFGEDASEAGDDLHRMLLLMQRAQAAEFDASRHDPAHQEAFEREIQAAVDRIDERIHALIARRRAAGSRGNDLLAMLLNAQDEAQSGGMTDQQVRDEIVTLFIAGHETTSVTLTWAFWLLGKHPAVYGALMAEVDAVLGTEAPTAAQLATLSLPTQIIRETLRLYPTAWILFNRLAAQATELAGIPVVQGEIVMASPYAIQRDARYFGDPDAFNPGHFSDGWEKQLPKFSYFPFGGGARICIGQHFALMEASFLLGVLAQRFRFRLTDPEAPVLPVPLTTLQPDRSIAIEVFARSSSP